MNALSFKVLVLLSLSLLFMTTVAVGQCGIPGTPPCKKSSTKKKPASKKKSSKTTAETPILVLKTLESQCLSPDIPKLFVTCPDKVSPRYLPAENDNGYDIAVVQHDMSLLRKSPQFGTPQPNTCFSTYPRPWSVVPCDGDFLEKTDNLVVLDRTPTNDWLNVINLKTGREGWVWVGHVKIYYTQIPRVSLPEFEQRRTGSDRNPDITIKNDTARMLSMRLGSQLFTIAPYQSQTINLNEGSYKFYASAPGVYPLMGEKYFSKGIGYTWSFYIK